MTRLSPFGIDYIIMVDCYNDFNLSAITTSNAVPRKNKPDGKTVVVLSISTETIEIINIK